MFSQSIFHTLLTYTPSSDGYTLVLSDNGVGLPEDMNFQNAETLGLELVMEFVKQIKGAI